MGLRFALARNNLAVFLGTSIPNGIGCSISRKRGKITFEKSAKHWRNIYKKVTPWWPKGSNQSGYFCNVKKKHGIRVHRSGQYYSGNLFALLLLWEIKSSPIHLRSIKYISGQEIWPGPTKPGDIS